MLLIIIPQDAPYYLDIKRKLPLCGNNLSLIFFIVTFITNHISVYGFMQLPFSTTETCFQPGAHLLKAAHANTPPSFIIYKIQLFLYIINKLGEDLNKTRPNYQSVIGIKIRITIKIKLNIIYIKLLNIFINLVIIELIKCKGA